MLLDNLIFFITSIIIAMIFTGGIQLSFPSFRLDLTQVDTLGIALLCLLFIRSLIYKEIPSTFFKKWLSFLEWATQKKNSQRFTFFISAFFISLLFIAHVFKNWSFQTAAFDQTAVHQPLFYPMVDSLLLKCDICRGPSYLSEHLSFTLLPLGWFLQWVHIDEAVFFIQILTLILSFYILFKWSPLRKFKNYWLLLALLFLSHRALRDSFLTFFREDHLAYLALIGALTSLFNGRIFFYFLAVTAAILSKENIAFIIPFISLPFLLDPHFKSFTRLQKTCVLVITILVPLFYIGLTFQVLIPYYSVAAEGHTPFVSRLQALGSTPNEILWNVFTRPDLFIKFLVSEIFSKVNIKYLILILIPYSFMFLKAWYWILPALPSIILNMVSALKTQVSQQFHYDLVILPFLIFGIVSTLLKLKENELRSRLAFFLLLALCFSGRWPAHFINKYFPNTQAISESMSLRSLPKNTLTLAANDRTLAHLSNQKNIILFAYFNVESKNCEEAFIELKNHSETLKSKADRFVVDSLSPYTDEKSFFQKTLECKDIWLAQEKIANPGLFPEYSKRFIYFELSPGKL